MATSLEKAHQDRIHALLRQIDEHLQSALLLLDPNASSSPLSPYIPDSRPIQYTIVADYVRRLRQAMGAFLDQSGMAVAEAEGSATVAASIHLLESERSMADLSPRLLRTAGNLDAEDERRLNALIAELRAGLRLMRATLATEPAPKTVLHGTGRSAGRGREVLTNDILTTLIRVTTQHGLTALQNKAEQLAEYANDTALRVCLLGRTNSGKSSLVNGLLESAVLPVGATPVTVVPVSIVYGPRAQATVTLADARSETFELWRVAEFASARANLANSRHVTHLQLTLPAALLREGMILIDTPGIDNAADDATWERSIPDFDLAVVVVDAQSALTALDTRLIAYARRCGSHVIVLLNKADPLPLKEQWEILGFVQSALHGQMADEIEVYLASAHSPHTELGDHWIHAALRPRIQAHQQNHATACERKALLLHDAVIAELKHRLRVLAAVSTPERLSSSNAKAQQLLDDAQICLEEEPGLEDIEKLSKSAIKEVAWNIAEIWRRDPDAALDPAPLILASQRSRARAMRLANELWGDKMEVSITQAIEQARMVLHAPCASHSATLDILPCPDVVFEPILSEVKFRQEMSRRSRFWPLRRKVWQILLAYNVRDTTEATLYGYEHRLQRWRDEVAHRLLSAIREERERLFDTRTDTPAAQYRALVRDLDELSAQLEPPLSVEHSSRGLFDFGAVYRDSDA